MKKLIPFLFLTLFIVAACSPSKEKRQAEITSYEKSLFDPGLAFDEVKAKELAGHLEKYVADFPNDSLSPLYLNKAADVYTTLNQPDKAVELLDQVIAQYPNYKQISLCYFLKGFVYDAAGISDKARYAYNEFIQKYPHHPLVNDAKASIENLGLSPEEVIRKFEAINADSSGIDGVEKK